MDDEPQAPPIAGPPVEVVPPQTQAAPKPLEPFKYPVWIIAMSAGVLALMLYSLISVPRYLQATRELHHADTAKEAKDYKTALGLYRHILVLSPGSESAKIGYAVSAFGANSIPDEQASLEKLADVNLSESEWQELCTTLPTKIQAEFKKVEP
jgi:hypothetical protein